MDITEIINRKITEPFDVDELCFVIEHYINVRKNQSVKIDQQQFAVNPFSNIPLLECFDIASKYLRENDNTKKENM